jgi:hypothetical protein
LAGRSGANAAAERMRSIATEALDPAGRAGGVAYLWGTPFAAGQACAVPRQPPTIDDDSYIRPHRRATARELGTRLPADALRSCVTVIQPKES